MPIMVKRAVTKKQRRFILEVIKLLFEIHDVGYNYKANSLFRIERPFGSEDYLFLFFSTEVKIRIHDELIHVKPNSFILYEPGEPQLYYNNEGGFTNDYFHFMGRHLSHYFLRLGVVVNTPYEMKDYNFIRFFVRKIEKEFIRKDLFWEERISSQMEDFFIGLARLHKYKQDYSLDPYKTTMIEKFKAAREEIFTNLSMDWTIDEMADLVYLSRSRFSVLYKEFFGCSPKEDLIQARMTRAKYLLASSTGSVKEVAEKVGYDNIYHFSKQFKKMSGHSPRKYVELSKNSNIEIMSQAIL